MRSWWLTWVACVLTLLAAPVRGAEPPEPPGAGGPAAAPADVEPGTEVAPPAALPVALRLADESDAAALRADLQEIFASAGLTRAATAVRVLVLPEPLSTESARIVLDLEGGRPLIPASTMKLITTAACLDRFGPDWPIRTHVGRLPSGDPKVPWDLAVVGGGDPNLSGRFYDGDAVAAFRRWAEVLKHRGVTAVGRLILDDSLFDAALVHPNWPANQREEWYEAPVSALSFADNCVEVHVAPGEKVGDPARVWTVPETPYVAVVPNITTAADRKEHRFSLTRREDPGPAGALGTMSLMAAGRCWVKASEGTEDRTVFDPAAFFGLTLAATLKAEGVDVAGPVVRGRVAGPDGRAPEAFICDILHTSRLDQTVAVANKRSQGLYAECLLKLLGAYAPAPRPEGLLPPRQGSWKTGADEVIRWLTDSGIVAEGCVFDDGSGLSKENRLTAACLADVLRIMHARYGDAFVETLSAAGRDGSLRSRMKNTPAEGRVFGKTGYVAGVSALSGYVRAKSGRTLVYAILMNGFPAGELWKARQAQDKACLRMVDY